MHRLGIVDFDTSHVVEFTKRLNQLTEPDQCVDGARIVVGCPGISRIAASRIPGYAKQMADWGIPLVDKPEEMIGKVDGVLVESLQGSMHLERARPFLEAGLPCFIDKPFANSVEDAQRIVELAAKHGAPVFSSSSLRYAPELVAMMESDRLGKILGADVHGPAHLDEGNPGLLNYGIHAIEVLYALLGPGCDRVSCMHEAGTDVVVGRWNDGRIGTMRGLRAGHSGAFGCLAFGEKAVRPVAIATRFIYRELLKQIVHFFSERRPPVDPAVTVEIIGFITAAARSVGRHGAPEALKV